MSKRAAKAQQKCKPQRSKSAAKSVSKKREHKAHLEGLLLRLGVGGVRGDEEVELLAERLRTGRLLKMIIFRAWPTASTYFSIIWGASRSVSKSAARVSKRAAKARQKRSESAAKA